MLCVRCKKRPAVVFVQKLEAGEQKSEGYCLRCAREMGIKPVDDLMKRFNITPEDMDRMEDSMNAFMKDMQSGDSDGMSDMMQMLGMSAPTGEDSSDSDEEEFVPGGSPAFPFGLEAREEKPDSKESHGPRKRSANSWTATAKTSPPKPRQAGWTGSSAGTGRSPAPFRSFPAARKTTPVLSVRRA